MSVSTALRDLIKRINALAERINALIIEAECEAELTDDDERRRMLEAAAATLAFAADLVADASRIKGTDKK